MGSESIRDPRLRVWSELVPHDELVRPRPLGLLRRFGLAIGLAVRPNDVAGLPKTLKAFADSGIPVALWPMLDDADGRWASAANVSTFVAFAESVVARSELVPLAAREIVFDVEPPIDEGRALLASWTSWASSLRLPRQVLALSRSVSAAVPPAAATFRASIEGFKARGLHVSAALLPSALAGGDRAEAWERRIGVPHLADAWDHVSVMLYTSLIEGWSRSMFRRADARTVLRHAAKSTVRRFGARAGVSIGTVGVGAFGTEPTYRDVGELEDDVAVVRRAGIDRIDLFDFAGVLSRPPAEAWLEAFTRDAKDSGASQDAPDFRGTARARLALLFLSAVGRGVARIG